MGKRFSRSCDAFPLAFYLFPWTFFLSSANVPQGHERPHAPEETPQRDFLTISLFLVKKVQELHQRAEKNEKSHK
jgi:hypothetical protein